MQRFLWAGQLAPVAELDGAGALVSRFVYATRANVPDYLVKGGQTYRLVLDHLGSVRLVVNTVDGTVAQRIDYDEFGRVTQNTAPGFQPFGYAGGLLDDQTGLVRFGARDYDPTTGRWIAKDPIDFGSGDPNLYAYAGSDPINYIDPSGRFLVPPVVVAGAVIGGVISAGFNAYSQIEATGGISDFGSLGTAFLGGAAAGVAGTYASLLGATSAAAGFIGGATGAAVENFANVLRGQGASVQGQAANLITSAVGGALGGGLTPYSRGFTDDFVASHRAFFDRSDYLDVRSLFNVLRGIGSGSLSLLNRFLERLLCNL